MRDRLCREIETALHRKMQTPKDFEYLRKRIFARRHLLVSATTLKRVWGYLDDSVQPRKGTLDILTQFLGYRDWEHYLCGGQASDALASSPAMGRRLSVQDCLSRGDRLRLTWQPERTCDIEYLGNLSFRVFASENTRLREGDTLQFSLIIEGEPLYIDNLRQGECPPIAYVCGKRSGVTFEYIDPAEDSLLPTS